MKLIVGLGNPGKYYAHNRHNVGFRCINYVSRLHAISMNRHQCRSQIGIGMVAGTEVLLAKPKTFVNLSGEAVSQLMRKYGTPISELLVIYDDLDLPSGKIRLRQGGRSGGHKGIKSIISALDSQDFSRIRIGIGRPDQDQDLVPKDDIIISHVLSDFTPDEEKVIKLAIENATEAIKYIVAEGITAAMNKFN